MHACMHAHVQQQQHDMSAQLHLKWYPDQQVGVAVVVVVVEAEGEKAVLRKSMKGHLRTCMPSLT